MRDSRCAMTQIELILVMAICGLLAGLLLSATQRARDAAARIACASNLRQIALAVQAYSDAHGHLPAGCSYPGRVPDVLKYYQGISWHTSILPYMEQSSLWGQAAAAYTADPGGNSVEHADIARTIIRTYLCPAEWFRIGGYPERENVWANTSYLGVAGSGRFDDDGVFHPGLAIRMTDITDGTSSTVMIGERPPGIHGEESGWYSRWGNNVCCVTQILPADDSRSILFGRNCQFPAEPLPLRPGVPQDGCSMGHFWSLHTGGANFAFADGSVRFLSYNVGPVLVELATRGGGEVVDFY